MAIRISTFVYAWMFLWNLSFNQRQGESKVKFKIAISIAVALNLLLTFGVATMLDEEIKFNTSTNAKVKESILILGQEADNTSEQLDKLLTNHQAIRGSVYRLGNDVHELESLTHFLQQENTRLSFELEALNDLLIDNQTIYEEELQKITDNLVLREDQLKLDEPQEDTATGGFGVLTGQHVLPIYQEEKEQEVINTSCPKIDRSVNLGDYISNIPFSRDVRVVLNYEVTRGVVETVRVVEGRASSKLLTALTKYLEAAIPTEENSNTIAENCMLPIKIEV